MLSIIGQKKEFPERKIGEKSNRLITNDIIAYESRVARPYTFTQGRYRFQHKRDAYTESYNAPQCTKIGSGYARLIVANKLTVERIAYTYILSCKQFYFFIK